MAKSTEDTGSKTTAKKSKNNVTLSVMDTAASTKKPVIVFFTMNSNCRTGKTCGTVENMVLRSPGVVKVSSEFHAVKIDAKSMKKSDLQALAKRYKVRKLPTVLFLSYSDKRLYVVPGKTTSKRMVAVMKYVLKKNAKMAKKDAKKKQAS